MSRSKRVRGVGAGRQTICWDRGLEQLEPRVLLSTTPLPSLSDMVDKNNTLIRMETDFGTVDIELFDVAGPSGAPPAPKTVANFLKHVRAGDFDLSFFHRDAQTKNGNPFVVQGGGFRYSAADGLTEVPQGDKIENEFDIGRSNLIRTIAMARLGGDLNSATTQFFFNMRDHDKFKENANGSKNPNFVNLDNPDDNVSTADGYTVFGRVLNDKSWDVIKSISSLTAHDYRDFTVPLTNALNEVPTKDNLSGVTPAPKLDSEQLIDIIDVEVIKEANTSLFYRLRAAYPEGFRGPATIESLELVNPSTDRAVLYQVIVRYEKGQGRDQVISTGSIEANAHLHIPVSDFNDPSLDVVREGVPYAYEVQATGPVGASLNHQDFGAATSESFINLDTAQPNQLQNWAFGGTAAPFDAPPDSAIVRRPFLVWDNISDQKANITITFTLQTGGRVVWKRTTDAMRRDGLEVFNLKNVTRDIASIRMESDQKIVAALTVYDTIIDPLAVFPPMSASNAFTALGSINGGLVDGALAGAMIGAAGPSYVSFVNHSNSPTTVTLTFVRSGAAPKSVAVAVPARGRKFYNLRNAGIPEGEFFSMKYHSPLTAVAAEYVSTINGDTVSTPFSTSAASQQIFTNGALNPDNPDESEVLSLYNPYVSKKLSVTITFNFADDKIQGQPGFQIEIDPLGRKDISVASLAAVAAKIRSGSEFRNYSILVNVSLEGANGTGGALGAGGVVAQMTRYNLLSAVNTNGGLYQLTLPLDSPTYQQSV